MPAPEKQGARSPLFDRLADLNPREPVEQRPARVLTFDEFGDSVVREVSAILNTRSHGIGTLAEGTVLDCGIPDLISRFNDVDEVNRFAGVIRRRLLTHDRRIRDVRIELHPDAASPTSVAGTIQLKICPERLSEPIWFEVRVEGAGKLNVAATAG